MKRTLFWKRNLNLLPITSTYEWVDDLNNLDIPELAPHEDFQSNLKGENITEDDYAYCQRVWREKGHKTFRDFLIWDNNLDVHPFSKLSRIFVYMFRSVIFVPGLSLQHLFLTKPRDAYFSLIDPRNKDQYHKIRNNIVGGPSIIFHRYHETGKTPIRGGN